MSVRALVVAVAGRAAPVVVFAAQKSEDFVFPHFAVSLLALSARSLLGCSAEAEAVAKGCLLLLVAGACSYRGVSPGVRQLSRLASVGASFTRKRESVGLFARSPEICKAEVKHAITEKAEF